MFPYVILWGRFLNEVKQNAPILLQTCQLWAVLSALSTSQKGMQHGDRLRSLADWKANLPELPFIQGISFSLIDVQGRRRSAGWGKEIGWIKQIQTTNQKHHHLSSLFSESSRFQRYLNHAPHLPGAFNFQCLVDGAAARYWMAILSPIVPLILVCVCGVMEMAKPGSGNRFGRMIYLRPQQLSFKWMFPAKVWKYPIKSIQNR